MKDPEQNGNISAPQSKRARTVYFIWRNLPRIILFGMIFTLVVLFFAIVDRKAAIEANAVNSENTSRPLVNVVLMPISATRINDSINLPGSIEPWVDLDLKAKIRGMVEKLMVSEGDEVVQGQVLALLEDSDYRIALDRAKAAHDLALADYKREKSLHERGVIPKSQIQARETALQTAKSDLENAQLNFSRCKIVAPIDGLIQNLNVKVGLLLSSGDPVGKILKIDRVKAVVGIPESDITAVGKLDTVDISIQALGNRILTGKRHFLSPAPDTIARLYRLELAIDNPERDILPGMFFRANVVKRTIPEAIAIPFYSVISRNDETFVFVEENGTAKRRDVQLGIMEKWMVQVTSGLSEGEKLVVEGHRELENDQKIKVVKVMTEAGDSKL